MWSIGFVGGGCGCHLLHHFQMLLATGLTRLEIDAGRDWGRLEVSSGMGFGGGEEEVDGVGWGDACACGFHLVGRKGRCLGHGY